MSSKTPTQMSRKIDKYSASVSTFILYTTTWSPSVTKISTQKLNREYTYQSRVAFQSRLGHCRGWVWGQGSPGEAICPWDRWAEGWAGPDEDHHQAWTSPGRRKGNIVPVIKIGWATVIRKHACEHMHTLWHSYTHTYTLTLTHTHTHTPFTMYIISAGVNLHPTTTDIRTQTTFYLPVSLPSKCHHPLSWSRA